MLDSNTVVVEQPKYLVRIWGRDENLVLIQRPPDRIEDGGALCYWFMTPEDRQVFLNSIPLEIFVMRSIVDPIDDNGEFVDTRACTWAHVVLRLPDGRVGVFEQNFGYGYPKSAVESMWEEGNYSCDCNKRLYLARECGIDPENDDLDTDVVVCGDTIALVSLDVYYKHIGD